MEFHYWRIDWGIAEPRIFLSVNMNGCDQRADDSQVRGGILCKLMCTQGAVFRSLSSIFTGSFCLYHELRQLLLWKERCLFRIWLYNEFPKSRIAKHCWKFDFRAGGWNFSRASLVCKIYKKQERSAIDLCFNFSIFQALKSVSRTLTVQAGSIFANLIAFR